MPLDNLLIYGFDQLSGVLALAGGAGGAKLGARPLPRAARRRADRPGQHRPTISTLHGLRICPDLDTVLYTLAGLANPATGWGVAGRYVRTRWT